MSVPNLTKRPNAVILDNKRVVGLMYADAGGNSVMDIFGMQAVPKLLAREVGKAGRSISLGSNGLLLLNGILHYRIQSDGYVAGYYSKTHVYSLDVVKYITAAKNVNMGPAMIRKPDFIDENAGVVPTYTSYGNKVFLGEPSGIRVTQTDLQISWDFIFKSSNHPGRHAIHGNFSYTLEAIQEPWSYGDPIIFHVDGGKLVRKDEWLASPNDLGNQFTLDHLQAPGYNPWRVYGNIVAFFNGSSSRVYHSEDVMNPYADLTPGQAEEALRMRIAEKIEAGNWAAAVPYFRRLWKLQPEQAENMYIRWAQVLDKSGDHAGAKVAAKQYLEKFGDSGQFSPAALKILALE